MAYKTILLHLDGGERAEVALDLALRVAAVEQAHLVVLCVLHPLSPALGAFGDAAAGVIADLQRNYMDEAKLAAEALRKSAERQAEQADIPFEWRLEEGVADDIVPVHARYADLTIVNQVDPDSVNAPRKRGLPIELVMDSGRPMLVVPYAGNFTTLGERILVAWNGSREATRAVHDAMPFLRRAELVSVLSINPRREDHIAGFDISSQLARHGVKAEAVRTVSGDVSVGDLLLSEAADLSADMIVMGAYGHSRLREFILGGASQQILDSMTVPAFMSH
ncbi:MAG: universal stress protein [Alphaproteobacteria bacterium]|jgi:nucleotide-binding universal stress UspA family protein|nr:universal stress protein [Alphaproteobacteria bacterium]MDP6590239.1 universal stress protein [Alphaproteobacteria bacterium]MDP6817845.1 universal stress protein [Alphaproteobacteria bacterium]|tara:strand:+ start:286 stop:1122 length:837 start_codon:yes stop_codon:yes gene_type:complete